MPLQNRIVINSIPRAREFNDTEKDLKGASTYSVGFSCLLGVAPDEPRNIINGNRRGRRHAAGEMELRARSFGRNYS